MALNPLPFLARLWLIAVLSLCSLQAHDHIEVGLDPANPAKLALVGPSAQTALFVPVGEPFSYAMPQFPGGYYACELTFSADGEVLDFAANSLPRIELLSVAGPTEGLFGFWEAGATSPTWTRPAGWFSTPTDRPSIVVNEDIFGYGHIHGRAFTFNRPGLYTVVFRAVDAAASPRAPSETKTVTFEVLATPQLSIRIESGNALLAFASRAGLTYDLQVSTDLQTWANVPAHRFINGTGAAIELSDPLADRPRVFYRLVEYL